MQSYGAYMRPSIGRGIGESGDSSMSSAGDPNLALVPVGAARRTPQRGTRSDTSPYGGDPQARLPASHRSHEARYSSEVVIATGIAAQAPSPVDAQMLQVAAEAVQQAQSNTVEVALAANQAVHEARTTALRAVAESQTDANVRVAAAAQHA